MQLPAAVFVWDNFGPMHIDRCEAAATSLSGIANVTGVELFGWTDEYGWQTGDENSFRKITLFGKRRKSSVLGVLFRLVKACRSCGRGVYFLAHYERRYVFLLAFILRICGNTVVTMNDSKLDDRERSSSREFFKRIYLWPYNGALSSGARSGDYFRFLGIPEDRISGPYDTLSTDRIREQSGTVPAPAGVGFEERHFICVARFLPKKNLTMLIEAYRQYRQQVKAPRNLVLCGSGELEAQLRARVDELGLADVVTFTGFVQSDEISRLLARSLALLLPSVEEQFGFVILEAQAMGLPVVISENCGARDLLVRSAVNGFVVEPDNPQGFAWFMACLSVDEELWRRMAVSALKSASKCDVSAFGEGLRPFLPSPAVLEVKRTAS